MRTALSSNCDLHACRRNRGPSDAGGGPAATDKPPRPVPADQAAHACFGARGACYKRRQQGAQTGFSAHHRWQDPRNAFPLVKHPPYQHAGLAAGKSSGFRHSLTSAGVLSYFKMYRALVGPTAHVCKMHLLIMLPFSGNQQGGRQQGTHGIPQERSAP